MALDIKVINALGAGHYADTLDGLLVVADKYRERASSRNDVRAQCAEKGVRYESLVFTAQGGCEKHAEAIISQIADKVAQAESRDKGEVKAKMLETISMSIARSVAKSSAKIALLTRFWKLTARLKKYALASSARSSTLVIVRR